MSKRKGVSAEEKRTRMLQLFYEKKDFFQLKELEKIAPKEKGIIAQSVKDVVLALVDDGLVDTEKIGTSVYFWAYPSKAKHSRKRKLEELETKLQDTSNKLGRHEANVTAARKGRVETEERTRVLERVKGLQAEKDKLCVELAKYKDCDPQVFERLKMETTMAKEAANRWTDNIFSVKSWCKNKFMIEETALDKQFGISPDLDYID